MENISYCQSCSMPLSAEMLFGKGSTENVYGNEEDGSLNMDYCCYCYVDGRFASPDETMEEMIESCIPHVVKNNAFPDEETARREMLKFFPSLKRWNTGGK